MNAVPADFQNTHAFKKLSVNYIKETLPGERLITISEFLQNEFLFEAQHKSGNNAAFRSSLDFRPVSYD
jgi:hypothetical protein